LCKSASMSHKLINMKTLTVTVEFAGIKKDITLPGDELVKALNTVWDSEDRIEFAMGLDLKPGEGKDKLSIAAKVFRNIRLEELTIGQLLILDDVVSSLKTRIEKEKERIRNEKDA